ncbi:MAG: putative peptidoglycan glycosyltransferase FtsW [Parachlamydiales bacterium]
MTRLLLLLFTLLLIAFGLTMVFNTSSAELLDRQAGGSPYLPVLKQGVNLVLGIGLGLIAYRLGPERLFRLSKPLLWGITLLLLLVFVPGIGVARNGAHRWIGIGPLTFQPSEFAKLLLPLYALAHLTLDRPLRRLLPLVPALLLIALEPDNGSSAILLLSLFVVCWLIGIPLRYWLLPALALALVGGALAYQLPYVQKRIAVYLNPELDLLGRGHQPYQAKIAAGSGGLLGRGIGQSMQKLSYLPEAQNDYIAAIFAEETGFLGMALLILLYVGVTLCGFAIAFQARTRESTLLAALATFLIAIQAFVNLAVVSGLAPSKGLNLPFFSQGGTCLIANITLLALLLSAAKTQDKRFDSIC